MKSPIFIFSLPRSGSTMLQRMLSTHQQIATESEPWVLLHLLYALKPEGTLSIYSHRNSQLALQDLIAQLPRQREDYYQSIRLMADNIYSKLCKNGETYFLDKTPRYYHIAQELFALYPDAKFIFLFRNPMDIYASMMKTWGNNTFKKLYAVDEDLTSGWQKMSEAYDSFSGEKLLINYEKLVSNPSSEQQKIFTFLGLNHSKLEEPALINLTGKLGDQTGVSKYKNVNKSSIDNWKSVFNTGYRKKVIKSYIMSLDAQHLQQAGYEKDGILKSIKSHKTPLFSFSLKDRFHVLFYKIAKLLNAHLLFTQPFKWARKKYLS